MSYQKHLKAFLYAVQFLTRIPVTLKEAPTQKEQADSALYYPVVGLLIGCILFTLVLILPNEEPMLLAVILLFIWVVLTGGLHLDGLADSADAWLGGADDLNRTHRILKDPLVGTAGVVAVCLILLIKYSALYALIKQQDYIVILMAPVIGRSLILLLFTSTDYVRQQGLASGTARQLNGEAAVLGMIPVIIFAAWFSLPGLLVVTLVFLILRQMMINRLGGCTGDTTGATLESGEAFWLLGAALF